GQNRNERCRKNPVKDPSGEALFCRPELVCHINPNLSGDIWKKIIANARQLNRWPTHENPAQVPWGGRGLANPPFLLLRVSGYWISLACLETFPLLGVFSSRVP